MQAVFVSASSAGSCWPQAACSSHWPGDPDGGHRGNFPLFTSPLHLLARNAHQIQQRCSGSPVSPAFLEETLILPLISSAPFRRHVESPSGFRSCVCSSPTRLSSGTSITVPCKCPRGCPGERARRPGGPRIWATSFSGPLQRLHASIPPF